MFSYNASLIKARLKDSEKTLIEKLSFTLDRGEKLAIVGETGSGKTITALSIMGLLPKNIIADYKMSLETFDGKVLVNKEIFKALGKDIVYIPQNGLEVLSSLRSVRKHLYDSLKLNGCKKNKLEITSYSLLSKVGFSEVEKVIDLYPFELSGGMAQKVTIAIALASKASVIIADEPTNGLDRENRETFIKLLESLDGAKIIITHDISLCEMMDKIILLKDGIVMESGDAKEVLEAPKCEYTKALINALCKNGMKETPVIRNEKKCCPFYSRCEKGCSECINVSLQGGINHSWRCINGWS